MQRSYRGYRGGRRRIGFIIPFLVVLCVLAALILFFVRNNVAFTSDGTVLRIPFSERTVVLGKTAKEDVPLVIEPPSDKPETPAAPKEPTPVPIISEYETRIENAVFVPRDIVLDSAKLDAFLSALAGTSVNTVILEAKSESGLLSFSDATAAAFEAAEPDNAALKSAFSKVTAKKLAPVAAISCFRDNRAPRREQTLACRTKNKVIWLDSNNITWLNPFVPKARTYITTLISELYDIGFREVMLSNVSFPVVGKTSILHYPDEASATKQSAISTFLGEVKALAASKNGLHISAVFDDRTKKGETLPGGQALADFTSAFYRVYAPADGADSAIFAKINAIITDKNVLNRFVPIIKTDDTGDGLAAAITAVRTGGRGVLLWSADGDYTAALSK